MYRLYDVYSYVVRSFFFFSSRRRHTRSYGDWSSDVCSSDLAHALRHPEAPGGCALPQQLAIGQQEPGDLADEERVALSLLVNGGQRRHGWLVARSEERRVGKEWGARWEAAGEEVERASGVGS